MKNLNYFLFAEYANTGRGKNKIGRFLRTKSEKRKFVANITFQIYYLPLKWLNKNSKI